MLPKTLADLPSDLIPLFKFWSQLTQQQQQRLLTQVQAIHLSGLEKQKNLLKHSPSALQQNWQPFSNFSYSGNSSDLQKGQELIQQGKVGCLLLAGGQGSRLRFAGPKGAYPISIIKHKSLFQLVSEKVLAASKQVGKSLSLAIMTSDQNHDETQRFFKQFQYFGLKPEQVDFFVQGSLPLLDAEGRMFLESPDQIAIGPNGNGCCLKDFVYSNLALKWHQKGIDYLSLILIDNPLADPFDAELIGYHYRQQAEVTLKCTERSSAQEKVGVLVQHNQNTRVIEYSEISEEERTATDAHGQLKHRCANLSLFCFSMEFIQKISQKNLPLHSAWKAVPYVNELGQTCIPKQPNAWKFETFIFDVLNETHRVAALIYPREECFAPLKNFTGSDSPLTVQSALQKKDRMTIEKLTGLSAPHTPFELAADFYYPTAELILKWKNRKFSGGYLEA